MNLIRFWPLALLLTLGLAMSAPVLAQSEGDTEPQITTRQEADRTVREYRVNDALYAIEIRPSDGSSYYLVDQDGDGNFTRQEDGPTAIPEWVQRR
ncbi:DUF2782 domain-containing protein [Billgrantia gudaonensis]|uniref:DUF2782 domain-containing protein n=1 Tax=Billgrantia gudaonensis TaxID=376427 RepID=A0A1G8Z250_9GAMM|nr:DUF2782 domain-containing protein [Halomonas gudaonensis]SDK09126.1 Protein of unknown function [Halomonas gudaonensis]